MGNRRHRLRRGRRPARAPVTSFTARLPARPSRRDARRVRGVERPRRHGAVVRGRLRGPGRRRPSRTRCSSRSRRPTPRASCRRGSPAGRSRSSLGQLAGLRPRRPIATWVAQTSGGVRPSAPSPWPPRRSRRRRCVPAAVRGSSSPHIGSPRAWARTGLLSVVVATCCCSPVTRRLHVHRPVRDRRRVDAGMVSGALLVLGGTGVSRLCSPGCSSTGHPARRCSQRSP